MSPNRYEQLLGASVAVTLLLLGAAIFLAVFNLGTQIGSFWLLLLVQIVVGLLTLIAAAGLAVFLVSRIAEIFAELNRKHQPFVISLKKKTPWFVVFTALISQAVIAVADKSFQGDPLPTLALTLVLIILFFLANHFIAVEQWIPRTIGFLLWFITALLLPFFLLVDRKFDLKSLLIEFYGTPLLYKTIYAGIALVFLFAPILFVAKPVRRNRRAEPAQRIPP